MRTTDDGLGTLEPIDTALLEYFEDHSPFVAVMLEGAWGAGKTHYLRQRSGRLAARAGKKCVSLSVAGLGTRDDLEQALFFAAAPLLDNGYVEALGIFTRAAMRWAKIDPDDIRPHADLAAGSVVVILDDMERFAGDFRVLFGFVVDLVDNNGVHVVIVASEQKLIEQSKVGGVKVGEWQEKVVGRTIRMNPDPELMIDATLAALSNRQVAEKLVQLRPSILNVMVHSGLSNFRAVKYALREIAAIIDLLGKGFDELRSSRNVLVEGLLIGLLEIKRDASRTKDISDLFAHSDFGLAYQAFALEQPDEAIAVDNSFAEEVLKRYENTNFLRFPGGRAFSEFFLSGLINSDAMLKLFEGLKAEAEQVVAPSVLNANVFDLEQEEFDRQVADIEAAVRAASLRSLGMVARIYLAMKFWSEHRLISLTQSEVFSLCRSAIQRIPADEVQDKNLDDDVFWFQHQLDDNDRAIQSAITEKIAAARYHETEKRREEVRQQLVVSDDGWGDMSGSWALTPLFVGDVDQWVLALTKGSTRQLRDLRVLMGRRNQSGAFHQHLVDERASLPLIADGVERMLPRDGKLTLVQSELYSLAEAFRLLARRLERVGVGVG